MTEYASLVVKVDSTDAKKASGDLNALTKEGTEAEGAIGRLAEIGKVAAAAIAAAGTAALAMAAASVQAADAAGEMAQSAGVSVEEFTRLQYAMSFDGAPEQLGQSLLFLNKAIADAGTGAGQNAKLFARLGVSVRAQDGTLRNSRDVMLDVADKFAGMQDGAEKAALAVDLFGRSGDGMIPVLSMGAEGIRALEAESDRLGVTISGNTAAAASMLSDTVERLNQTGAGFANGVMAQVLPALSGLAAEMLDASQKSGALTLASDALVFALKSVLSVGVGVAGALQTIGGALGGVVAAAVQLAQGNLGYAAGILKQTYDKAVTDTTATMLRIDGVWTASATAVEEAEKRKQTAIGKTAAAAAGKPAAAASAGPVGSIVIEDFGAVLARQAAENQQRLVIEQAYLDLKAKMYAKSDEGQRELRRLQQEQKDADHQRELDRLQKEQEARQKAKDAFVRLLDQAGAKSKTAAKAAEALQKASALRQIAIDTPVAALGAYKSLVGIPFVGPALAAAAYASVYALGATAASAVMSGSGGGGGSAPATPSVGGTGSLSSPTSPGMAPRSGMAVQIDVSGIGADDITTGAGMMKIVEHIFEKFGETVKDGGMIGGVKVVFAK